MWERYLAEKEGLALDALHDEAMRREHSITPEEADRLDEQLGHPKFDPHGDPIPPRGGELPRDGGTPLSRWPERRVGRVVHVEDEPPALLTQLALMGLTPGAQVEVDERTPGRVLVWSGRQRLALAPAAAERVFVVPALPERVPLSEMESGRPRAWRPSARRARSANNGRRWAAARRRNRRQCALTRWATR